MRSWGQGSCDVVIGTFIKLRRETRTHTDGFLQTSWLSEREVSAYCWSYLGRGALAITETHAHGRIASHFHSHHLNVSIIPRPIGKIKRFLIIT